MAVDLVMDETLCAVLGCTPGSARCRKLEAIAHRHQGARGQTAPLDLSRPLLVYVARGAAKLVGEASAAREQIVAFHLQGDLVPVAGDALHGYHLTALTDSCLVAFDEEEFLECASANPAIMRQLIERAQSALHRSHDKAIILGRKSAQERVASFLYALARRTTSRANGQCVLDLPMSRRDIGDSLGLTIETVSRQFGELRAAGLIETCGRSRVLLPNIAALAGLAGYSGMAEPAIAHS